MSLNLILGDIIDGATDSNVKNIKARTNKGIGIVNNIMNILEDNCFGPFNYEVMVCLRNSLIINSLLANSMAWY